MKIEFVRKGEKKKILELLKENYGIEKLPYLLIKSGKNKLRLFSGNLSKEEIKELSKIVFIEGIGLYFASFRNNEIRLTLDSLHLLKKQIKDFIEISEKQLQEWFKGLSLDVKDKKLKGFVVLKHKEDFVGIGKASQGKIFNYLPKERRRKI